MHNLLLSSIFTGVFEANQSTSLVFSQFLLCLFAALVLGLIIATVYKSINSTSQSFAITLALLPAVVAVVIMMVNGNVGTGVAVAGAFSLVRFRSQPGTAKEIAMLFLAMGAGLMCGMGYLIYALVFSVVLILALLALTKIGFGTECDCEEKALRITIPESLNYSEVFDDVLEKYTSKSKLVSVKTTNMGSMFKLNYSVVLKDPSQEKAFIDALRVRNGNLEISVSDQESKCNEL